MLQAGPQCGTHHAEVVGLDMGTNCATGTDARAMGLGILACDYGPGLPCSAFHLTRKL